MGGKKRSRRGKNEKDRPKMRLVLHRLGLV